MLALVGCQPAADSPIEPEAAEVASLIEATEEAESSPAAAESGYQERFTEQGEPFKGDPAAPVVIEEFSSYQCSFCRQYFQESYPQVMASYIETGQVLYVFRDFPLPAQRQSPLAAEAANCAGQIGGVSAYWALHDRFFERQAERSRTGDADTIFKGYAAELGLDAAAFGECLDSGATRAQVEADVAAGGARGVRGTPTFFINGQPLAGAQPYAVITQMIDAALAEETAAIHMAYFSKAGCPVCAQVNDYLEEVQDLYPQLIITEFPIEDEGSKELSEWLGQRYGVPEELRLTTPMVFVGEDYLVGRDEVTVENLQAVLDKYVNDGAEATWKDFDLERSETSIVERFRSFGILTVAGAGLMDGLNPCAFATIVFFISYLAFLGRKGREILAVGAAFALGVFLTYLLVGMGLLKVLEGLPFLTALSRWVYGLTALLCLTLAIFSFQDYRRARRGEPQTMTLRIPPRLRRQINRIIREGAQARAFVPVAFATGFVVSIIELACTGQVYLPTIIFVMGMPEMQEQAFFYLLLYNLAFILPLVVVFGLAYFGTTSEQLGIFINRRTATIKLGTALLFLVLAGWLVAMLV